MRRLLPVFVLLMLLVGAIIPTTVAVAQAKLSTTNTKARHLFEKAQEQAKERDFTKALETLSILNDKFPSQGEPFVLKGSLLKAMGENQAAFEAYRAGLAKLPPSPTRSADYYTLGELAMTFGDYQTASTSYKTYLKLAPKSQKNLARAQRQLNNCDFAIKAMANPVGMTPERLGEPLNTYRFQYFPALTADNRFLLYTIRPTAEETSDENLFIAKRNDDGSFGQPVSISPLINTPYNEGASTISGDGKTLVFTSCDRPGSVGSCDLYISRRTGNNWSKPVNLGRNVNSPEWDSQPTLSADGRTLYYTSTRRGGKGQEDIYVTNLQPDDTWSVARNVGEPVNTPGKDMAPFIHASGTTLYYVTDGLVGMGGLDVYRCEMQAPGRWSEPRNLGYPLNTFENEASLFITSDNRRGFCSRSRATEPGVKQERDRPVELFGFEVPAEVRARETSTYTQGRVFDATTKKPLRADVQLYDLQTDELVQYVTSDSESGDYTVVLNEGRQYAMYAVADKYLMKSLSFDYTDKRRFDPLTLDIYLEPVKAGRSIVLNNLFFDTNQYNLKPKSRTELNRLIQFMRQYKDIEVEISGHTDDVGADSDNMVLSQNRAKAVYNYLVANEVKASRLRFKGYGETKPLQPNDSDIHRQQNRRIEFRIL
ncbi:cell envelope biogenesis protein OmpA [Hymenobacter qilianensis]|uniref:Cell envelope biogenesis protein OmpA n=2 Tax=Hymenobacter qilianensis TaxID=1385715 RepID=A0ACB5PQE6_9BACT|nr:OmpA family protein [Hymenobacter qilianensis]QNP51840.1 PD40 domain-containing protein [Hymenobacter qilianensis]GGF62078.1 cell envelope biogenesis protein OmpA [Hymenobacter qilianensis]